MDDSYFADDFWEDSSWEDSSFVPREFDSLDDLMYEVSKTPIFSEVVYSTKYIENIRKRVADGQDEEAIEGARAFMYSTIELRLDRLYALRLLPSNGNRKLLEDSVQYWIEVMDHFEPDGDFFRYLLSSAERNRKGRD